MQPSVLSWKGLYAWGASAMETAWVVRSNLRSNGPDRPPPRSIRPSTESWIPGMLG